MTAYKLPKPPPAPAPSSAPAPAAKVAKLESTPKLQSAPVSPKATAKSLKAAAAAAAARKSASASTHTAAKRVSAPIVDKSPYDDEAEWKTFEWDIDHWQAVFKEIELDTIAQQELYLLAQYSELGKKAANHIVGKILKKLTDGQVVHNWSALVHSHVKDVRHTFWQELLENHGAIGRGSASGSKGSKSGW